MERHVTVEEVRKFLSASDRQFVKGGIRVSRVRFKRDEEATARTFSLTTNRQFQRQGKTTLRRVQNDKTQTDPADTDKSPAKGL